MEVVMDKVAMMNREEIIEMICESSVYDLCTMLEEQKIKDVVPIIDQSIDELADCLEGTDYD